MTGGATRQAKNPVDVYWLEQIESDVPAENDWLNPDEAHRLNAMRFAKRRTDWRLGRWTAKCALAAYLKVRSDHQGLSEIELRAEPCGAPEAYFANRLAPVSVSLSHRDGTAICAVARSGTALGCDLETIEPRSDGFLADYFTPEEQALVARASGAERFRLLALLWSAKESALKALRTGLRRDTRSVTASVVDALCLGPSAGWRPLHVRCTDGPVFHGWWQQTGNLLRTLVAAPPPLAPIELDIAG
jgi:4'-phosphopantetheinyl transferase